MVNPTLDGLEGRDSNLTPDEEEISLEKQLQTPTDTRLFAVQSALEDGWTVDKFHQLTKIDKWFLSKLKNIATLRQSCKDGTLDGLLSEKAEARVSIVSFLTTILREKLLLYMT